MNEAIIRTRYAKALFQIALEKGKLDEVKVEVELMQEVFGKVEGLQAFLDNPLIKGSQKRVAFMTAFNGEIKGLLGGLINLVFKNQREALLKGIFKNFIDQYEQHKGILRGKVKSAVPINSSIQDAIQLRLEREFDKTVIFDNEITPDLIGGFSVEIDGILIDASIKNTLSKIKTSVL